MLDFSRCNKYDLTFQSIIETNRPQSSQAGLAIIKINKTLGKIQDKLQLKCK